MPVFNGWFLGISSLYDSLKYNFFAEIHSPKIGKNLRAKRANKNPLSLLEVQYCEIHPTEEFWFKVILRVLETVKNYSDSFRTPSDYIGLVKSYQTLKIDSGLS